MNLDKNTIIGLLLMLLLGLGFSWYTALNQEKENPALAGSPPVETAQAGAATTDTTTAPDSLSGGMQAANMTGSDTTLMEAENLLLARRFGSFAKGMKGTEEKVVLQNSRIRAILSTRGGMFESVSLLDGYTRYQDSAQIVLWDSTLSAMVLNWKTANRELISSDDLYFMASSKNVDATENSASVSMRLDTGDPAKYLELIYTLEPDSYTVTCALNLVGLGDEIDRASEPVVFDWSATGYTNEKGLQAERSKCSVYYRPVDDDRDYLSEGGEDEESPEEAINWVAFKQDFFSAAVISPEGFKPNSTLSVKIPTDSSHTKSYGAKLGLPLAPGANASANLTFFFGPNDYKVLRSLEVDEFDRIIDYGWGIIGWVNTYAIRPLFWFFSSFIGSFGLIILIVTLIIKMVLFPVTWKNYLSSAKMRVLKPEMDEINRKFEGKEAAEKQQAVMSLYRQTGVNPFAGCIPVLFQMPILYAMFRFFPAEIVLRGKNFLWADDLAAYDSIFDLSFNIPFYGSHVSGFTLLMCASTFIYTRMSSASQPAMTQPGMPNMKIMMNVFTLMMLFFFNSMPSGLSFYYFTANMISIGQMWVIKNYIIDEDAIRAKIEDNKKKPKKKSSFQQRLEDIQKNQQKKIESQKKGK